MSVDLRGWEIFETTNLPVVGAGITIRAAGPAQPNLAAVVTTTTTSVSGEWSVTGLADGFYDVEVTYLGATKTYKGLSKVSQTLFTQNFGSQTANTVLAAPVAGGYPTFQALALTHLPTISQRASVIGSTSGPTTSGTGFSAMDGTGASTELKATLTCVAGSDIMAWLVATVSHGTANGLIYGRILESVSATAGQETVVQSDGVGSFRVLACLGYWAAVAAGAHTVTAQWRVDAGTATANGTRRQLIVEEIRK
jgi:hypothetical protein